MTYKTHNIEFEGEWFNNKRQGEGMTKFHIMNKGYDLLVGNFEKQVLTGYGFYFLFLEDMYFEGNFTNYKKNGEGSITVSRKTKFEGIFKDD